MVLISHRANYSGPDKENENSPFQIDKVLSMGFYCEIDVWVTDYAKIFLGHDKPEHNVGFEFLLDRYKQLYIHAKNGEALKLLSKSTIFHFFAHSNDEFVVTSKGEIWCYPSKTPIKFGINLMPEWNNLTTEDLKDVFGICSDYIGRYL
jgi:hypothetical protein